MPAAKPSQAQITRAVKGAMQGGFPVGAVEVCPDGTIRILPAAQKPAQDAPGPKEW